MGANDEAWAKVLEAKARELERVGQFEIDAAELKRIGGREPRLMAKHDFSTARPAPFQELGLNILPVSRSRYVVGRFKLFEPFPNIEGPVRTAHLPAGIESLGSITSETLALGAVNLSGMLEDFLGGGRLLPTVAGRMSTGTFEMEGLTVDRAQMEIDGGYESPEHLVLVEAKNHLAADFNIRQLYFPYRRFQQALSKEVVPVYLVYTNGIFSLYRYTFRDPARLGSIALVDAARYALSPSRLGYEDVVNAVRGAEPVEEDAPFPQANSFARVVNLVELLAEEPAAREEISAHYDFDPRQADYYANAGRYLGLLEQGEGVWQATELGRKVVSLTDRDARNLAFVRQMARHRALRAVLEDTLRAGAVPGRDGIGKHMTGLGLKDSTVARRTSTVQGWAQWVLDLVGDNTLF